MKQKLLNNFLTFTLLILGGANLNPAWATDYSTVLSIDCATASENGSSAKYGVAYSTTMKKEGMKAFLEEAAGTSGKFTVSTNPTSTYWAKGNGGTGIPGDCLKVGTASGSGSFSFTIDNSYDEIDQVVITGYGWKSTSEIAVNGSSKQSPTSAASKTDFTFNLESSTRTITISVTTSAVCITSIVLKAEESVVATALSVGTAPTKLNYKVGETLDLTGLVLNATVGGTPTDVTSGYSASPANGATLDEVGAQTITITYGGQTTTQTIHVGALESIAITTEPETTTYNEGQTFDPTGMVVEATFSDGEDTPTEWTEEVDDYTYSPSSALETSNTEITVSYEWDDVEKTATQDITVNAGVPYTVTFDAGTGSCGTTSLTEASFAAGVTLPTATISVTGWSFAGWAASSTTNTEDEPTLYDAGDTYNPTDDCTLYAVYKFTETSATSYKRATSVSDITSASSVVIVSNANSKVLDTTLGGSVTAPTESSSKITAPEKAIFTLTGDNTDGYTLTNGTVTIGASSTSNSTVISNTTTNDLWVVKAHSTTNTFYFENKGADKLCLENYNSSGLKWMVYAPSTPSTNTSVAMKVYVPVTTTVYNSNPAAIVNPTIAWTTDGNKTLYLQKPNTYTNAASVTGIAKSPVYTSSDETVATVTSAGVVEALKKGTATIKATVDAEMGVNTKAEVSYVVTVKDASNVAGLKEVATSSTATSFTADLTDAVVTYVNGSYAYIEDASGAIYASCGSSLTAGKKINGAVSGSVKVSYQIDEITAIDLSGATVEDGVIPSAIVQTTAQVVANKATLEGKLVSVTGAKVTVSLTSGNASGGKIKTGTDDEINLYAPASNIDALKDAEGTFNGYISLYNGGLRLNIYDQSQITLTKNAPTAQTLTFASDAVELDEETSAYSAFAGQTVSGAQGTVTYSIDSNDDGVVTSITASTGAVVLSGSCGTATIKATAAEKEVTVEGVTTPYTETTKTYTITVYPRYTVTFSANGVETPVRQASHGASVEVPSPSDVSGFKFMGWSASTVLLTDKAPTMESLSSTVTPEADETYYAVYAVEKTPASAGSYSLQYGIDSFTPGGYGVDVNVTANDGSSWVVRAYNNGGMQINSSKDASIKLPTCPNNITTIVVTCSSNNNFTFGTTSKGSAVATPTNNTIDLTSGSYTTGYINPSSGANIITKIVVNYGVPAVYENYCTTVPAHVNIAGTAGYTTYVATDNVSFPSGTNAYIATKVNTSTIHLEEVAAVPDGTAVIVKGDKGVYLLDVEDESDCDDVSENLLLASDGYVTGGTGIYALAKKSDFVGFYPVSSDVTIPAGKAYLDLGDSDVKAFTFVFEDEEDGIKTLSNSPLKGENIYNLAGQRISKMQKGINIVNGKKILK